MDTKDKAKANQKTSTKTEASNKEKVSNTEKVSVEEKTKSGTDAIKILLTSYKVPDDDKLDKKIIDQVTTTLYMFLTSAKEKDKPLRVCVVGKLEDLTKKDIQYQKFKNSMDYIRKTILGDSVYSMRYEILDKTIINAEENEPPVYIFTFNMSCSLRN